MNLTFLNPLTPKLFVQQLTQQHIYNQFYALFGQINVMHLHCTLEKLIFCTYLIYLFYCSIVQGLRSLVWSIVSPYYQSHDYIAMNEFCLFSESKIKSISMIIYLYQWLWIKSISVWWNLIFFISKKDFGKRFSMRKVEKYSMLLIRP